jgi:hypothetical protein
MILNASDTRSLVAPPPTSRKLAGNPPCSFDDVHRAHRQAGAVDHATDIAVQGHVIQFPFSRVGFALIFLAGVVHRAQLWLTVQRVAVDTDLRVEAVQVALLGDHQRIDFYQRQILVDEHLSQTHENLRRTA